MIISDLNHLEVISQETSIVGGFTSDYGSVYFNENVRINKDVDSDVDPRGHFASAEADANAYGYGSIAETFTRSNTSYYGSNSSSTSIAASP